MKSYHHHVAHHLLPTNANTRGGSNHNCSAMAWMCHNQHHPLLCQPCNNPTTTAHHHAVACHESPVSHLPFSITCHLSPITHHWSPVSCLPLLSPATHQSQYQYQQWHHPPLTTTSNSNGSSNNNDGLGGIVP
jgi:hypothetical protein